VEIKPFVEKWPYHTISNQGNTPQTLMVGTHLDLYASVRQPGDPGGLTSADGAEPDRSLCAVGREGPVGNANNQDYGHR
jgi:hypothetical protein